MSGYAMQPGLKCKTPGCDNSVVSHKGYAGWCVVLQSNGKTHRQEEIDARRARGEAGGRNNFNASDNGQGLFPSDVIDAFTDLIEKRKMYEQTRVDYEVAEEKYRNLLERELEKVNQ